MKYLYRIVNALFAAAVFPAALFLDGILLRASTSLFDYGLEERFTFMRIINIFLGKETFFGIPYEPGVTTWPEAFNPMAGRLIASIVFFAITLAIAIFIFFWSVFSNKRLPIAIASASGIVTMIVSTACFKAATDMLINGSINIVNAFTDGWIASLLGGIVNIDRLEFGGFQNGILICFIFILAWTGAYYLIEVGSNEEKVKKHN